MEQFIYMTVKQKKLLCSYKIQCFEKTKYRPTVNNITSNAVSKIFIALSDGEILSLNVEKDEINKQESIYQTNNSINAIEYFGDKLYIGDDSGTISTLKIESNEREILIKADEILNPCTCLQVSGEYCVAGYVSGHIKIVELHGLSNSIRHIALHRRPVTSICLLPKLNLIATVSDDGHVQIIKNTNQIQVIRSKCIDNCLLCGIQFIESSDYQTIHDENENVYVLVSAYDKDKIAIV